MSRIEKRWRLPSGEGQLRCIMGSVGFVALTFSSFSHAGSTAQVRKMIVI